ncbi:MAG TPA: malto-oligosyltrehalose synthase [Candidatus Binatia bacterium]|nr:malto-oligosyltrehalose synthase [Candidatus Binatia bacterium]
MLNDAPETVAVANTLLRDFTARVRVPCATYRLQFNRSFTFAEAARVVSYLHALGISDCYSSPYFKACPGSPHGYDVIDHNTLNPELGSDEDYQAFTTELRRYRMGQILDVVPNHVGIAQGKNPRWADVLENGPSALSASFFDIDWAPVKAALANKVLLPILGDQYGRVLENQELVLSYQDGAFFLVYYDHQLPIAPRPSTAILSHRLGDLERTLGADHRHFLEFRSIITALNHLPLRTETDREKMMERSREKEIIKKRLAALTAECAEIATFVADNVRFFNGSKGEPRSFDPLDTLLDDQAYRLAYWRVAAEEINYRRFFDINELAAVRTEDPAVFTAIHQLPLRLLKEGKITGLRIDHVDGLYNPSGYLGRLQQAAYQALYTSTPMLNGAHLGQANHFGAQGQTVHDPLPLHLPCYVVVEKILSPEEYLPEHWPVHGTTGYDFLAALNGIFIDQDHEKRLTDIYTRFTRTRVDFPELVYASKKLIMLTSLSSEINLLAHQLEHLSERNRHSRDFTLNSLTHAIREIIACFPVYRTYIEDSSVSERDRAIIERAVARAKRKNPVTDASVFNFVRDVLLLRYPDSTSAADREAQHAFVMKFQQYTGPVIAKGVEDTAFYIDNRLVSLNEVGGTPEQFGLAPAAFHQHNRERLGRWPHTLLATTTHDTKRSEDVRARINVLSEIPREWGTMLNRWSRINRKKKPLVEGQPAPDRNEEYLLYQTLLGTWPSAPMAADAYAAFKQRIQAYMHKATKEAKVHTSWINPHQAYDDAVQEFVSTVIDGALFFADFQTLRDKVAQFGLYNSLAQALLKLTVPGVPDLYQGTELWDFSLVDPDNRRPVDYDRRRQLLDVLQERIRTAGRDLVGLARGLLDAREDGRIKLYMIYRTLNYRREHPGLFSAGTYLPLEGIGSCAEHVCAFARQYYQRVLVVAVPRLLARLVPDPHVLPVGPQIWGDAWLTVPPISADQCYRNLFTGETVEAAGHNGSMALPLDKVFANFPVALLVAENR